MANLHVISPLTPNSIPNSTPTPTPTAIPTLAQVPPSTSTLNSPVASAILAELDVEGFVHWKIENGSFHSIVCESTRPTSSSIQNRVQDQAALTIRSRKSQSCILASPNNYLVVSQPIAVSQGECDFGEGITAWFPCELTSIGDVATERRFAAIERLAASIESIRAPSQIESVPKVSLPICPDADEPTWSELLSKFVRKVKTEFALQKAKFKTYLGFLVALVAIGLIPWPYQIACKVVCEPASRRFVAAPFDARLLKSHVVIGQQVTEGQVLATLDGSEIRSELAVRKTKLAQAAQRQLAALSVGDHSKAEFERLEVEHFQREIELFETRQRNLEIRSPINGVVITGNLERTEGAPLSIGDNLFEIASLDQLIAEVGVPEEDISYIDRSMNVTIELDATPGRTLESTIESIHLRNEIRDNASVFIAEAKLSNPDLILRPGMSGTVRIHAGHRTLGWVWLHRPYNELRHWIGW